MSTRILTLGNRLKDNVNTGIIILYFFLGFLSLYELQLPIVNALIVCLGTYIFLMNYNYIKANHSKLLFIFILFAVYSVLCLFFFQDRITYTPIRIMVHFALFIAVMRYNINPEAIKWLLYIYVIYILYLVFAQNTYINDIFPGSSKNLVGWLGLGLCVFYYLLEMEKKSILNSSLRLNLLPAIITLILCMVTLGRSNIICAFLILSVILWYNLKIYSLIKKIIFISIIALVIISLIYKFYDLLDSGLQRFDQKGFESSERDMLIDGYFDKLDFYTFLLGISSNQPPFVLFNGNFHNSFLLGHSSFGVLFILFVGFMIQLLIRNFFKSFLLVILALALLVRSFTDTIMFIGDFDFILFVLLYKIKKG